MRFTQFRVFLTSLAVAASVFAVPAAHAQPVPPPTETPAPIGAPAPITPDVEEIQAFSSRIFVNEDGTITVTERIDYWFPEPKHGIYRDIPVRYEIDGKILKMPIDVQSVHAPEGPSWQYDVQKNKDSIRIKIGDPDVTISGAQTYIITYAVSGALRYFDDHDELYWNVTGNGWEVPIRRTAAEVTLPDDVHRGDVTNKCFTGDVGSTAQDCLGQNHGRNVSFAANGPLTVVVGWNKGVVATLLPEEAGFFEQQGRFIPFLLPVLVLLALLGLWHTTGRDPEGRGTLMAQYEPPDGMTPAEVAGLCNQRVVNKDLSAVIVHLAVRGYLEISETEKKGLLKSGADYAFHRLKDYENDAALLPFEKHVLKVLFDGGILARVSDIAANHTFYKDVPLIAAEVLGKLVSDGHYGKDPAKVRAAYMGIGIVVLFGLVFLGAIGEAFSGSFIGNLVLSVGFSAVLFLIFGHFMPRRTPKGVIAYEHALGFKDYLSTAEKYRLQWHEKEHIFETFLPYAMIFGVVDKWSKTFEGMQLPPPSWYHGSSVGGAHAFNAVAFYGAINSMNGAMSSAMISHPSSSSGGSGFGGSSGGGGGGGGGGSW